MEELAFPNKNLSWYFFNKNKKNVILGALKYFFKYCFLCPIKVFYLLKTRINFAVKKQSLVKPLLTPNGFSLINNSELLSYTQIFVELNLYNKLYIKDFLNQESPIIIDVGYNCGFFVKWLNLYNTKAEFFCFEVLPQNIIRAQKMDDEAWSRFIINKEVFNKAVWNKSDEIIPIYVGDNISTDAATKNKRFSFKIETIALDDFKFKNDIFLLKIDTDGSNLNVLIGAKKLLSKVKWLLIENESNQEEWLIKNVPFFSKIAKTSPMDTLYKNLNYV